jgi:tRNA (guanosine-2'-O-)-methyltransferase
MSQRLFDILSEHLSERKRKLFDEIAEQRTRYITLVLEDLYQPQNTSAIQRSAESWGIQDLHIIENHPPFHHHRRIARGAYDWLTSYRYNEQAHNTKSCFERLRKQGYQIAVTALHTDTISIYDLPLHQPTAIVMGTELTGASNIAMESADAYVKIPTYGFTESLNVAAAAAVIAQHFSERIRQEQRPWQLSEEEKLNLKIEWAKKSIYWSQYLVDLYESGEV